MSPAPSAQVRRRQAARKAALERQQRLNEDRRRRDGQELDLAAEFGLLADAYAAARDAVAAAELAMGRVVDQLIGELRVRYPRAAQLLVMPEDELRRLRQLAADSPARGKTTSPSSSDDPHVVSTPTRSTRPRARRGATTPGHSAAANGAAVEEMPDTASTSEDVT